MICSECGARIPDDSAFCPECGAKIVISRQNYSQTTQGFNRTQTPPEFNKSGTTQKSANTSKPKPRRLPGGVQMAEGEEIVKQYYCSRLRLPRCDGYMVATNKRLMFYGSATNSRVLQEIPIDSVGGISATYGTHIRWFMLIISVILFVLGIALISEGSNSYRLDALVPVGIIVMLSGPALLVLAFRRTFTLCVRSSKAVGNGISIGAGGNSVVGNAAEFSVVGFTATDTDKMLNELGALVHDLQTSGDHAIEKWRK